MAGIVTEDKLQHFKERVMQPKLNDSLLALERYYEANKDKLVQDLLDSMYSLCQQVIVLQETETKADLGYITFSMLRTELIHGRAFYLVEATDENWFFDPNPCTIKADMGWAFESWFKLGEQLEWDMLAYQGTVIKPEVEQLMLEAAAHYHQYVIRLARYALRRIDALPQWSYVNRHTQFEVRVGEYLDQSECVLKLDESVKEESDVRLELEEVRSADSDEAPLGYQMLRGLNLSDGNYVQQDIRYSDFSGSHFSRSQMPICIAVGAHFRNCQMDGVNLYASLLNEADFSGASLRGALLRFADGSSGLKDEAQWTMPGFEPLNFSGADLTGADFEHADMRGAIFVGSKVEAVNFKYANLQGAIFLLEAKEQLNITEQQRFEIVWQA
ncbi:pentapeptide repeat-containing protein [Paenibacillus arenosi]|uniref:Pentapeptide repeat-containing protein n=1 Tax=Paenibacillus arenosi TaxID=2774142 RepID=A0ABR9AXH7_9BACL|nr:pentapeptide repeat-containing protein [Paenibacillus arenosi]MBD8498798.1 pentapeptide repeat-containing protein [Paenibacillus arenosi]